MKLKIAVCARHILLAGDEIEFSDDGLDIAAELLEPALSEWDQAAVEAALRLRDQGHEVDIVLVSAASDMADPILRRLLAMGADRAWRIDMENCPLGDAIATARLVAPVLREEAPDLILCGVQSADHGSGAFGAALAGLLDRPVAAAVKDFTLTGDSCTVLRELEGGLAARTEVRMPAVLTIQTGIFQPRYANLRAIKLADQKELRASAAQAPPSSIEMRRMALETKAGTVELLGTAPADVAHHILKIVKDLAA